MGFEALIPYLKAGCRQIILVANDVCAPRRRREIAVAHPVRSATR